MGSGPISKAQVPSMKMCTEPEKISQKIMAFSIPDKPRFLVAPFVAFRIVDEGAATMGLQALLLLFFIMFCFLLFPNANSFVITS
jgi:hypothetical protein